MQFCDNTETPREYVLEIDEDFDATKLVAVYADVDLGGNLPDVEILSGLFYDGKPLTLYDEGDDEFLYAKNLIARFSKYKHSNDKGIMVGDGFGSINFKVLMKQGGTNFLLSINHNKRLMRKRWPF